MAGYYKRDGVVMDWTDLPKDMDIWRAIINGMGWLWTGLDWSDLPQDMDVWRIVVHAVMNHRAA